MLTSTTFIQPKESRKGFFFTDKIVIICPLWLFFLILLALFLIIFRILSAKKKSQK